MSSKTEEDSVKQSFEKFQEKLKDENVLNSFQLKTSCNDFLNSSNLEICVKSLLFEIIFYQTTYEKNPYFQIPVENVFQKENIDLDNIFQDLKKSPNILKVINICLNDLNNVTSFKIVSLQNYFWYVTFPNLFGAFTSSESCIGAKEFIQKLFESTFSNVENSKSIDTYARHVSSAVISFISHNYSFYDVFHKTFFCELIYGMRDKQQNVNLDFKDHFTALKNALKAASLTFNQHQIEILQRYFDTEFPRIQRDKSYGYQYQEILDKLVYPAIKIWKFSPYFQKNDVLFYKEGNSTYQQLKDYLNKNPKEIITLIQPFIDNIKSYDKEEVDDLVSFSNLFLEKSSKVLTILDIAIIKGIQININKNESEFIPISDLIQGIYNDKSKLMFFYQVIKSNSKYVSETNSSSAIYESLLYSNIENSSLHKEFKSKNIPKQFLARWLKLKERIKYGSDYDEIIKYQAGILRQFSFYDENVKNKQKLDIIESFIEIGNIEHNQDINTRDSVIKNLRNFAITIKLNSNILDDILIPYSAIWIQSIKAVKDNENHFSGSFIESLKDFYSKYKKYEYDDSKDDTPDSSCIDLSNVGDSKFDFLKLLINENAYSSTNTSETAENKERKEKLNNDEYRSGKESANNFYSFLLEERKPNNDIEIIETKRSIEFLYQFYMDYIKRGLLLANKKTETITLIKDNDFKNRYKETCTKTIDASLSVTESSNNIFNIILEETLPFLSYLLRPMIYDIEEKNNKIEICLDSFENISLIINKMLNQLTCYAQKDDIKLLSSISIYSAIKYIWLMPIDAKKRKLNARIHQEDQRREEELKAISVLTDENEKRKRMNQENKKREEEKNKIKEEEEAINNEYSTINQEFDPICKKKLMTFYKFLVNQNIYRDYPELQKLKNNLFYESKDL